VDEGKRNRIERERRKRKRERAVDDVIRNRNVASNSFSLFILLLCFFFYVP
jgi:hypothetical protein